MPVNAHSRTTRHVRPGILVTLLAVGFSTLAATQVEDAHAQRGRKQQPRATQSKRGQDRQRTRDKRVSVDITTGPDGAAGSVVIVKSRSPINNAQFQPVGDGSWVITLPNAKLGNVSRMLGKGNTYFLAKDEKGGRVTITVRPEEGAKTFMTPGDGRNTLHFVMPTPKSAPPPPKLKRDPTKPIERLNPVVSPLTSSVVMKALAIKPAQRWQSAAAMRDAFKGGAAPVTVGM